MIFNQNFYQKAISILKFRYSSHSSGLHPFDIEQGGIKIFQDQPVF
jgi:KaiC/GvpD/RAD55 family RecA-like ATPase